MKQPLLLLLFAVTINATAQDLSGNWAGSHSNSLTSFTAKRIHMSMVQKGDSVHGSSRCIDNATGQYTICTLRGVIKGNAVTFYEEEVLESEIDNGGGWCLEMHTGVLIIDSVNKRMIITGMTQTHRAYSSRNKDYFPGNRQCPPGDFILSKSFAVSAPPAKTIPVPPPRKVTIIETFKVVSDSLTLSFYDDGETDGDTITVYYNNKVILKQQRLAIRPVTVTVPVLEGMNNELVMFADNVGSIPPNTALLVFYDEGIRRHVTINSDTKKSGAILIRKGT